MRRGDTARPSERVSRAKTPRAAADLACPQGRRGINPSRGRETPRTEGVGPGGPSQADPSADVAEGARNLRRGDPVPQDRGGRIGPNPERETKPGSRRAVARPSGRPHCGRPRGRRNDEEVAANHMSPLRSAERSERPVNPARVVSGTATSRPNSRSEAETPEEASTDLSVSVGRASRSSRDRCPRSMAL